MGEGVGEGNKLFSMTFGPKACTLRNLVLAKSKSREEEQGQAGPCVVILSRSPKSGRPGACVHPRPGAGVAAWVSTCSLSRSVKASGAGSLRVRGPIPPVAIPGTASLSKQTDRESEEKASPSRSPDLPQASSLPHPDKTLPFCLRSRALGITPLSRALNKPGGPLSSKNLLPRRAKRNV